MDKKILIVVIIVAILIVSSIAAIVVLSGNGGTNDNGSGDGGGTEATVESASSFQFKVSLDPAESDSITYEYSLKNAGTSNLMMRIEMESAGVEYIYIINGAQEKVWTCSNGEWMEFSELYQTYWETWTTAWEGYRTNLLDWTGYGDWSYTTQNGDSVRIYDISINPSLSDSLFQH
jgi:hypothetical protein